MSWQAVVDDNLMDRGLASAAIFHVYGNLLAASQSFSYKSEEITVILQGFENPAAIKGNGFSLGGTQYSILMAETDVVIGKKGTQGICIKKTINALIIIGICDKPMEIGRCAAIVEEIADALVYANRVIDD
ncbi:Profilin [Rhynchospora pubera]|uniref:Profilin n=1 Tax=Rhynchospora pubera TaxID=906938 RepID=A0AAV8FD48_9POAL|nr:Profilin [Rhynchospora pubera]KAJ4808560.1 Profilin [Rhynchospora pubera]